MMAALTVATAIAALSSDGVLIKRTCIRLLAQYVTIAPFLTLRIGEQKYKLAITAPMNLDWIKQCSFFDNLKFLVILLLRCIIR